MADEPTFGGQPLDDKQKAIRRAMMIAADPLPLTQDVYHGTTKDIPVFKDRADDYSISHGLGVHVARDPKVSNSAYFVDRNATSEGGNMMPLKTFSDDKFYPIEQKLYPHLPPNTPKGPRTVRSDDRAVTEAVMKHAFKRDPALLKRTLMEQRALSADEAEEAAAKLRSGVPWEHHGIKYRDVDHLVEDHLLTPWNPEDRAWASRSFRDDLIRKGYAGVKYINTSPNETEGVDDPTCYIVFNKPTSEGYYPLRGRFAAMNPADKGDPDLMKAEGGTVEKADGGPIDAYHGSPHDFDKFDFSKIGTGEGAQAYGHGIYLAGNPEVAQEYRRVLGNRNPLDIARLDEFNGVKNARHMYEQHRAGRMMPDKATKRLVKLPGVSHEEAVKAIYNDLTETPEKAHIHRHTLKALDEFVRTGQWPREEPGHMYDVNIHEDPEKFLDLDRPLSEQSPSVKKALALRPTNTGLGGGPKLYSESTGMYIPDRPSVARAVVPVGDAGAAAAMEKAGVAGARYYDGYSRGDGEGSRNYVVFPTDKELLEITRKYAQGGPIRAYHGSPFDFDRFNFERIGSGEGAQSYGHGLYFAGHEPVARSYRDTLAKDWHATPTGTLWTPDSLENLNVRALARRHAPDLTPAIERAHDILSKEDFPETTLAMARRDLQKLGQLQKQGGVKPITGRMYEVAIHADPEKFLDWDRPLRDQRHILEMAAESVGGERAARQAWKDWGTLNDHLAKIDYNEGHPLWQKYNQLSSPGPDHARIKLGGLYDALDKETANPEKYPATRQLTQKGEDLYRAVAQTGKTNVLGSQALQERGVPGVKYLDAMSRGVGEGTSNYVVFPTQQDIVEITRKYAHGGATKDERRALMIARDQRALLRRIANIYPGPGGGMDPSPGGGGYAGPGGGKYIGPSRYADGGSVEFKQDNPAVSRGNTDWLESKQRAAASDPALLRGAVTGYLNDVVHIPVDMLEGVPGANKENPVPGTYKYDELMKDVKKKGWKPSPILVGVNHKGKPYILEGNHRAAVARALGQTHIPGDIRWFNGGEEVEGPWHPKNVAPRLQPYKRANGGNVPPFKLHSGAAKLIAAKGQKKATPQQYAAMPGIKPDELKHSGFDTLGSKALPREEVIKHLEDNAVPLQETLLRHYEGDYAPHDDVREDDGDTKFHTYQLPGGHKYREVLLRTPAQREELRRQVTLAKRAKDLLVEEYGRHTDPEEAREIVPHIKAATATYHAALDKLNTAPDEYKSGHWDQPNVLAHLRMSDRKGPNGEKVLHVEEVQSDWGQQGRKHGFSPSPEVLRQAEKVRDEYHATLPERVRAELNRRAEVAQREGTITDPVTIKQVADYLDKRPHEAARFLGESDKYDQVLNAASPARTLKNHIPSGPYVDNTQKWTDLALKRVLHEAAHGGYDKIAFTPGEEQNKRYPGYEGDLRPYYDNILPKRLQALAQQHDPQAKVNLHAHSLAEKPSDPFEEHKQHYADSYQMFEGQPHANDTELRRWARDFSPDDFHGVDDDSVEAAPLHSLDVTPQMRESIKGNGFSQFKRGGYVQRSHTMDDINRALDVARGYKKGGKTEPSLRRAPAEEINRFAKKSKGLTQAQLRQAYHDLGLTSPMPTPSRLAAPALGDQPEAAVKAATDLKLADLAHTKDMSKSEREEAFAKGQMPSQLHAEATTGATSRRLTKEIKGAEKSLAKTPQKPIFDLSTDKLSEPPDVEQFLLPRVDPKRTDRIKPAFAGGAGLMRLEKAAKAAGRRGLTWYQLKQIRDHMLAELGPEVGNMAWDMFASDIAGTSMTNPISGNIRTGTKYYVDAMQGKPLPQVVRVTNPYTGKTTQTLAGAMGPPYGAKAQVQHAARVREFLGNTFDPVANPKPISYRENLRGNLAPRTIDTHDIRNMVGMPYAKKAFGADEGAALLPGEYSALEELGQKAANRAKVPQAQQQAGTWIGGGKYTGLKSVPVPFLEEFNRRALVTAMVTGKHPDEVMSDFYQGRHPFYARGGVVDRALAKIQKNDGRAGYAPGGGVEQLQQNLSGVFSNLRQQTAAPSPMTPSMTPPSYQGMVGQATGATPDPAYQRMLAQAMNGKSYEEMFPNAKVAAAPTPVPAVNQPSAPPAYDENSWIRYNPTPTEMLGGDGGGGGGGDGGFKRGGRTVKKVNLVERALAVTRRK